MPEKTGLNKGARLAEARRVKAYEAGVIPPLDPPFPFAVMPFDPAFFGMPANPGKVKSGVSGAGA